MGDAYMERMRVGESWYRGCWGHSLVLVLLAGSVLGCSGDPPARARDGDPARAPETPARGEGELSEARRQELLAGYEVLANTLADEAKLGKLEIAKKLTLDAPNEAVAKLMDALSEASERHAEELEALRKRAPQVAGKPDATSPFGDAVNAIAKDLGQADMLSREGGFDVRFVLVQAQATRMVAAMSTALARFDPDPKRQAWLRDLAREYEQYRGDLIAYLGGTSAR